MTLPFHRAADIFDPIEGEDFAALVDSIRRDGLAMAIWLHPDGSILDGRNRYRACVEAGIEPRFATWNGEGSAADFVYRMNHLRRHYANDGVKQLAAARYAIELETEARERQISAGTANLTGKSVSIDTDCSVGRSRDVAAEKFGIPPATVGRGVTVLKHGTPEEIKSVEQGEAAVSAVAAKARKRSKDPMAPVSNEAPKPQPTDARFRIAIPEGMTVEELAREMVRMAQSGSSSQEIMKRFGTGQDVSRQMQEIVELASRDDLPPDERDLAARALDMMNELRSPTKAYQLVVQISERLWGEVKLRRSSRPNIERDRAERFEHTATVLVHLCEPFREIEIPHLSRARTGELVRELGEAIASITAVRMKLKKVWS